MRVRVRAFRARACVRRGTRARDCVDVWVRVRVMMIDGECMMSKGREGTGEEEKRAKSRRVQFWKCKILQKFTA